MSNAPSGGGSKIQIDSDWKAEAQAEKARLEEKVKAAEASRPAPAASAGGQPGRPGAPREMPKASLETLVQSIASQAMLFLGIIPDPRTGQRIQHLDMARHHIDTLGVLEEKSKNNLTEAENKLLSTSLYELRQAYIQVATAIREQKRG